MYELKKMESYLRMNLLGPGRGLTKVQRNIGLNQRVTASSLMADPTTTYPHTVMLVPGYLEPTTYLP